ncbi:ROK family transcriptional regulator [Rarobacter incanus]|uniref:Putative NBD/HSP70 family sugar kinase n=1 Tax=Rarobacter incanus TaxID=153494 RepID=A0A542SRM5_9MICO|nr:ROK family transcriptional regulator [Rarobacter incanus]TQK77253.1 putative NBD/HSP70 family sugar kinase [Rarobacter incanus]
MTKVTTNSPANFELSAIESVGHPPRIAGGPRASIKAQPGDSRWHNRRLVLQTLYTHGPISRADIARATKLTKATVSDLVAQLADESLVYSLGTREARGPGKPAVLIDLARSAHATVCLDLSGHELLRGAIIDIAGNVIERAEIPLGGARGNEVTALTVRLANDLAAASPVAILGMGVGTPGVVDDLGTVRTAPNLGWHDEALRSNLETATGIPTVIANDANAAAIAEHALGDASDDLMLVTIGHGVGAGLIVDGRLVMGSRYASGEIGQVMVGTDLGLGADYSRDQVLEHWLSVPNLRAAMDAAGAARDDILREAGQRLGVALAPVIGALNLAEVVLAGPPDLVGNEIANAALEIVQRRTMSDSHDTLTIRTSDQGQDLVLLGAMALVLQNRLGVS